MSTRENIRLIARAPFVFLFGLDPVLVIAIEIDRHCTTMSTIKMRNIRNCLTYCA